MDIPLALTFRTIANVEPLDAQFGVDPKKTVPDALHALLFGHPDPTTAEIALAGCDPATVPPLHSYAIVDAARAPNLAERIEASGLPQRCLFKGEAFADLKDAAPWLVRIEDGNTFTRNLFTRSEAPWHLWDCQSAILLRAHLDLEDLWRHLRKFTRLRDQSGKWFFFRSWAPMLIEPLCDNPHQFPTIQTALARIMGDVVPAICSLTPRLCVRIARNEDSPTPDGRAVMPDRLDLRRLSLHRNMILATDDIFELGPPWVVAHYGTRRALSVQLRQFIDFCLDCGIDDSDIRSHLMQLIFALDRPRWPECLATRAFVRMAQDRDRAEALAMDWIYSTRFYLKQSDGGRS